MKEKDNLHKGHRERVKNSVLINGLEDLQEHEWLEYLLFFCIPLKDTNPIAHNLIKKFGSFDAVLDATVSDLCEISGMTANAGLLLHTLPQVFSLYERKKLIPKTVLSVVNIVPYLRALVRLENTEVFYIVCLDAKNSIIYTGRLGAGTDAVNLSAREVVKIAMLHRTKSVILCHNHPSGIVLPSNADIQSTAVLKQTLSSLDIKLIDHVIVSGDSVYSFFLKESLTK